MTRIVEYYIFKLFLFLLYLVLKIFNKVQFVSMTYFIN